MGLLHTITAAFMITASEASRCVPLVRILMNTVRMILSTGYGRKRELIDYIPPVDGYISNIPSKLKHIICDLVLIYLFI